MLLVDEGRVSLIDPVEKYLPEYKGMKLNPCEGRSGSNCAGVMPHRPINIEDLMTHTSGLVASVEGKTPPNTLAEQVVAGRNERTALRARHEVELQQPRHQYSWSHR